MMARYETTSAAVLTALLGAALSPPSFAAGDTSRRPGNALPARPEFR